MEAKRCGSAISSAQVRAVIGPTARALIEPASASSIHSAYQSFLCSICQRPTGRSLRFVDCAREFRFPIHPTVCFKVGRFTITQSSWTAPSQRCSRKWMSGHAAIALVLLRDRGQFATLTIRPLGEPIPPSQGESPFPLDFYPSWMSTKPPFHETPFRRSEEL